MNFVRLMLLLFIAVGGYAYWKKHPLDLNLSASKSDAQTESPSGFTPLPTANGHLPGTVYVMAAKNCPHEAAQQADSLTAMLSGRGVPVKRIDSVNFSFEGSPSGTDMDRINAVMNSPGPVVFFNGRAKMAPSLDDVLVETGRK